MILIADSGSSKTSWCLIKNNKIYKEYSSIGLNPYYADKSLVIETLLATFNSEVSKAISQIFFYGAGCSNQENKILFQSYFSTVFTYAKITIEHDLLAAARALCKKESGIAAIIGTGCNSCVYDGKTITQNNLSLGYILGDEGSGAYIGKIFITDFLNKNISNTLNNLFNNTFDLTKTEIINAIYKEPLPSKFLAKFAKFVIENKSHEYSKNLINKALQDFINAQLNKYKNINQLPINFTGSIAYYLKQELKEILEKNGYKLGLVIDNPINELVKFHLL